MMYLTAITSKEMRLLMRSRKAFIFLFLLLIIMSGVFVLAWEGLNNTMQFMGRAGVSRMLFTTLTMGQLICLCFLSPIMTATSITSERENRTLSLLYCTGISPLGILLGKWISAIGYQLLVVICLLPITSLIFQLGGVGFDEYIFSMLITAAAVATYGMVGIAVSVRSRKSMAALSNAIGIVFVWIFFSGWMVMMLGGIIYQIFSISGMPFDIMEYATILSPVYAMAISGASMMNPSNASQNLLTSHLFLGHLAFQACVFSGALLIAWRAFATGELIKPIKNTKSISSKKELRKRKLGFPFYLIDPLRKPHKIRDNQDPLIVKERRVGGGAGRNLTALIRMCYIGLGLSVFLIGPVFSMNPEDFMVLLAMTGVGIATLLMTPTTATLVTRERENDTFDQLMTLPVSEWRIVWSKFRASLRVPIVFFISMQIAPVIFYLIFEHGRMQLGVEFLKRAPYVLSFVLLYSAVAIFFSAICRRNVTAVIFAFMSIGLMMLTPLLLIVLHEAVDSGVWRELGVDQLVALITQLAGPFVSPYYSLESAVWEWDSLKPATEWGFILTEAAGVTLLALGVLRAAAWRLAQRRES